MLVCVWMCVFVCVFVFRVAWIYCWGKKTKVNLYFSSCILSRSLCLKWVVNCWLITSKKKNKLTKKGVYEIFWLLNPTALFLKQWSHCNGSSVAKELLGVCMNALLLCLCVRWRQKRGSVRWLWVRALVKENLKLKRLCGKEEAGKKQQCATSLLCLSLGKGNQRT